jgi:SPOR domain
MVVCPAQPSAARAAHTKVAIVSTESIASSSSSHAGPAAAAAASVGAATPCPGCGAPLAGDQRYCLECGEPRVPMSSHLFGGLPPGASRAPAPAAPPPAAPPGFAPPGAGAARNNTLVVIAGVGVLLLAMGVGVLIGRAGSAKQSTAPAQVITVAQQAGTGTTAAGEATFTGDWPAGTRGYTVQLQALAQSGTSVSAVESAKSAASAKGAKAVGALKSEEFSSLTAGDYVIYSGVYHKRAEAEKALAGLKKSFPGAKVIKVSNGASSTTGAGTGGSSSGGAVGSSESHPAPPSVLKSLQKTKGKSYAERSKDLPDVVETG